LNLNTVIHNPANLFFLNSKLSHKFKFKKYHYFRNLSFKFKIPLNPIKTRLSVYFYPQFGFWIGESKLIHSRYFHFEQAKV